MIPPPTGHKDDQLKDNHWDPALIILHNTDLTYIVISMHSWWTEYSQFT